MFRYLRSKIILSFCLLMIAGGMLTTVLVKKDLSKAVAGLVDQNTLALAQALAMELIEPLAYSDNIEVKQILVRTQKSSKEIEYLFIVDPDGRVIGHSFPGGGFPLDLLKLAKESAPAELRTETGMLRDVSVPIADGTLGRIHIGLSMTWTHRVTLGVVRDVMSMTALAMVVGILGITLLAHLITRPILELTENAKRMESGGSFVATPVKGGGEVAELAIAFNRLVSQIHERISESNVLRAYVENVIDHLSSSVIVVGESGVVEYANSTATDWYGELVGASYKETLAKHRPNFLESVQRVLETGEGHQELYSTSSGNTYQLDYQPMAGESARRLVLEKATDLTNERQMTDRLHRAERLAVTGDLAAGVVHSINNPLDGVRRAIHLLPRALEDENRTNNLLALADEGCERIAKVTRTLLDFARVDTDLEMVPMSLTPVIKEALKLVQLKATSRNVAIRCEASPDLPEIVADPQALREVLINLFMNGVDACRGHGGEVLLRADRVDDDQIEIVVIDNGSGIAPEIENRIFEPFVTAKKISRGTGLGLSVARRVVEAHNGKITAAATPGGGATFLIRLPLNPKNTSQGKET